MSRLVEMRGPIFYGAAVMIDHRIQVAWLQPNLTLALRDKNAAWTALQHGFPAASDVNRYVGRRFSGEIA